MTWHLRLEALHLNKIYKTIYLPTLNHPSFQTRVLYTLSVMDLYGGRSIVAAGLGAVGIGHLLAEIQ